jgi:hypothetical protein
MELREEGEGQSRINELRKLLDLAMRKTALDLGLKMDDLTLGGDDFSVEKQGQVILTRISQQSDEKRKRIEAIARDKFTTDIFLASFKEADRYYLKAMNCPHHHRIFAAEPRSYRDLPLRLAEYGTNYRYEQSGELFGLMRVRSLNMNDAHIYCTEEQFAAEFNAVNDMYLKYFKIFGIEKYIMRFSTHDPSRLTGDNAKFVNEPELWKKTETSCAKFSSSQKSLTWKCPTKRLSTDRKLTCRSGASSGANSPWRPTRWISPCRPGSD